MNHKIIFLDEVDSTNEWVKRQANLTHGTVVMAAFQTRGKGQYNHRWEANPNENILMTRLWRGPVIPTIYDLQKNLGLLLVSVLSQYQIHATMKAPNDILVNNKKIAGILLETQMTEGVFEHFIIGIGLNVNQREFPDYLPNATSMAIETSRAFELREVLNLILTHWEQFIPETL
jgi:biotin-[acetyl-CoA-carboxylase] ligase BirA-like protein